MAPAAGDFPPFGNKNEHDDFPPPGVSSRIPTVSTATMTADDGSVTATVAYLINSWRREDEDEWHTYTFSTFDNLSEASATASLLASQSQKQAAVETGAPQSQNGAISSTLPTNTPAPASSASGSDPTAAYGKSAEKEDHHGAPTTKLVIGILVPVVVATIIIAACVICVNRRRRRQRKAQAASLAGRMSSEMRDVGSGLPKPTREAGAPDERAYLAPPDALLPPTTAMAATTNASGALGREQPVILSTTMNSNYYTGIDTSDHISLSDQRSMASNDTFGEEPPPPYRPRSVPPISRETSVRTTVTSAPNRNSSTRSRRETLSSGSVIRRSHEVRSPFDDPEEEDEDDDDVSEVSTIRGREADRLSEVSDLSYQDESPAARSH